MNCPNCGANLKYEGNMLVCEYCGYQEMMPAYTNPADNDNFFNLIVVNEGLYDTVEVNIPDCRIGFIIRNGEAAAKDIPAGYHSVVFTSNGKTEYRNINIPSDGRACKVFVNVGALGLVIRVSDPEGRAGSASMGPRPLITNPQAIPILALIFSFMFPLIGIVFCILEISMAKKENRKVSPLVIAAFAIIAVRLLIYGLIMTVSIVAQFR